MFYLFVQRFILVLFLTLIYNVTAHSEVVNKIDISGNDRIPTETIILFSKIKINDDVDTNSINEILKNLYDTDYFDTVDVSIKNNILNINVKENPVVYNLKFEGLKSETI